MNTTARPQATSSPPTDKDVTWFGASRRLIGGQPDSRYGWLQTPQGPCVVKALNAGLAAYAATLLQHETAMLHRLQQIGAPVPALVETGRDDWLVTRFAGVSLQRLEHPEGFDGVSQLERFPFAERVAAWVHLLRRLQAVAERGVLVADLYSANVVLPLTAGTQGQLRLREAALIDHAHTLEAGFAMRRPMWLDRDMQRIAPELREALRSDQEALKSAFRKAGAALPGYSRLPGEKDDLSRRVWAEYDAPQRLQQLLDEGSLSSDRAMQFAAGTAMTRLLLMAPSGELRRGLAAVLLRMTQPAASDRYPTLTDAATALAAVGAPLPMVSNHRYPTLRPTDLMTPASSREMPELSFSAPCKSLPPLLDTVEAKPDEAFADGTALIPERKPLSRMWLYVALALGAAIGANIALPW